MDYRGVVFSHGVTRYDPVQRSNQWKHRIAKEEKLSLDLWGKQTTKAPLAAPEDVRASARAEEKTSAAGGGAAPAVPQLDVAQVSARGGSRATGRSTQRSRTQRTGRSTARSQRSQATARSQRSQRSHRSGRSGRSGRSTARSRRSEGGSTALYTSRSAASQFSLRTDATNLTEAAIRRIERLERTLEEEKQQRLQAEGELKKLQTMVLAKLGTVKE